MRINIKRALLTALPFVLLNQAAFSYCPSDDPYPCDVPVINGYGCGTYGTDCCHYTEYRCPGSSIVYRQWYSQSFYTCQIVVGEYDCRGI